MLKKPDKEWNGTGRPSSSTNPLPNTGGRHTLSCWQGWLSIAILLAMLYIVVRSLTQAAWIIPQPSLELVLVLAVLTGLLLGWSRIPGVVAHPLSMVLGVGVSLWQGAGLQPDADMSARFSHLMAEINTWWQAASANSPSPGTIQVALLFCLLVWLIGYISTWFVLRRQNPWVGVSLSAIALLISSSYLPKEYYDNFLWFLVTALLLAAVTASIKYQTWLGKPPVDYAKLGGRYLLPAVLCLIALMVSVAWLPAQPKINLTDIFNNGELSWSKAANNQLYNFFADVPGELPRVTHDSLKELPFSGSSKPNNDVLAVIKTQAAGYWWTKIYDVYTSSGWLSSSGDYQTLKQGMARSQAEDLFSAQNELIYSVIPWVNMDVLLGTGELVSASISVKMQILTPDDVVAITSSKIVRANQSYTITARVSTATPLQLSQARENYPGWVTDRYLQLPSDLPDNIRQLAHDVTSGMDTPYDKALAIDEFLSHLTYSLDFEAPPPDVDGVENFLFITRTGDCTYFASAMSVMLRAVGVPSRVDTGYNSGQWDEARAGYVIRETNSHAWVEVYFPGYGWMTFDPTPGGTVTSSTLPTQEPAARPTLTITIQEPAASSTLPTQESAASSTLPTQEPAMPFFGQPPPDSTQLPDGNYTDGTYVYDAYGNWLGFESDWLDSLSSQPVPTPTLPPTQEPAASSTVPTQKPAASSTLAEGGSLEQSSPPPTTDYYGLYTKAGPSGSTIVSEKLRINLLWGTLSVAALIILGLVSYRKLVLSTRLVTPYALYAKICLLASLVGLGPKPQQTAFEHSSRLSAAIPLQVEAINNIIEAYVTIRYSRSKTLEMSRQYVLKQSWRQVRDALLRRLFRMK